VVSNHKLNHSAVARIK